MIQKSFGGGIEPILFIAVIHFHIPDITETPSHQSLVSLLACLSWPLAILPLLGTKTFVPLTATVLSAT